MRSTCSEVSDSRLKPRGMRWPSMSSCVKPPPSPRRRGGPPRPGAPGVVTPGSRRSTSPTVASPNLSISSRPITILAVVDWRRRSVSVSRPPVISTCWPLEGSGAGGGVPAGGTSETGGADAAAAGAEAVALGAAEGADAGPAAAWACTAAAAHARTRPSGLRVAAAGGVTPLSMRPGAAAAPERGRATGRCTRPGAGSAAGAQGQAQLPRRMRPLQHGWRGRRVGGPHGCHQAAGSDKNGGMKPGTHHGSIGRPRPDLSPRRA